MAGPEARHKQTYKYDSPERKEVRERFRAEGVSISSWAVSRGFNAVLVYRVISGEVKGERGAAHKIAVALGLKRAPATPRFRPANAA